MTALITETVVFQRATMSWADIMADRIARGLEGPATVITRAPRKARAPKVAPIELPPASDPRLPSNLAPCTAPAFKGERPKAAAGAAKSRRALMAQCACRLCALALRPPLTFAEVELFGLGSIAAEHAASEAGKRGPQRFEFTHTTAAERRDMIKAREANDAREAAGEYQPFRK